MTQESWDQAFALGRRLAGKGEMDRAEQAYLAAAAAAEDIDDHGLTLASTLSALAQLKFQARAYDEAETHFKRVVELREAALGAEHPLVVSSMNNLAAVYVSHDALGKAEPILEKAVAATRKRLQAAQFDLTVNINNLVRLYVKRGDYAHAEPLVLQLLLMKRPLGPTHPDVAAILVSLARIRQAMGRTDDAGRILRRVLAARQRTLPADDPRLRATREELAKIQEGGALASGGGKTPPAAGDHTAAASADAGAGAPPPPRAPPGDTVLRNTPVDGVSVRRNTPVEVMRRSTPIGGMGRITPAQATALAHGAFTEPVIVAPATRKEPAVPAQPEGNGVHPRSNTPTNGIAALPAPVEESPDSTPAAAAAPASISPLPSPGDVTEEEPAPPAPPPTPVEPNGSRSLVRRPEPSSPTFPSYRRSVARPEPSSLTYPSHHRISVARPEPPKGSEPALESPPPAPPMGLQSLADAIQGAALPEVESAPLPLPAPSLPAPGPEEQLAAIRDAIPERVATPDPFVHWTTTPKRPMRSTPPPQVVSRRSTPITVPTRRKIPGRRILAILLTLIALTAVFVMRSRLISGVKRANTLLTPGAIPPSQLLPRSVQPSPSVNPTPTPPPASHPAAQPPAASAPPPAAVTPPPTPVPAHRKPDKPAGRADPVARSPAVRAGAVPDTSLTVPAGPLPGVAGADSAAPR